MNNILFTAWWCYTGWVKRVIVTFLSYYTTLFRITSPYFVLHHNFSVLPHPFGIIFTLFPYYLILLVLFSHFFRKTSPFWYYFHTFRCITSPFWYYFHTFSCITSPFCYYELCNEFCSSPFHRVIVNSSKPRIALGWIQNIVNLTRNLLG